MADYYIDPENHTGSASDTAGGGTSAANPYLNLSFAFSDVVATHGKASPYGDSFKIIGNYAPDDTESTAAETAMNAYGTYIKLLSDGATAFGTHSKNSRATISGANLVSNVNAIKASTANYCFFSGFNLENPKSGNFLVWLGTGAIFDNVFADINEPTFNVTLVRGQVGYIVQNSFFRVTASTGFVVGIWSQHRVRNNIFILSAASDSYGLKLCGTGANSINKVTNNTFVLTNGANAFSPNTSLCAFDNNLVIGTQSSSNSNGIMGWAQYPLISITNNHFENLRSIAAHSGTAGTTRSENINMINNTYYNVQHTDTPDPAYDIWTGFTRNNVQLANSGVVDGLNEDLRPTNARVGATAFSQLPITGADWVSSMTNGTPIINNASSLKIRDLY